MTNKEIKNQKQREYRQKNGNAETKKYEKTKNGFLMRLYRNMQSRIQGIQKEKFHLYEGKTLVEREVFYDWAKNNSTFHSLFDDYEKSNYDRKLAPSVDRINSKLGYELSNMEFITHSENSRRGAKGKGVNCPLTGRTHNHAPKKKVYQFDINMNLVGEFESVKLAGEAMGVSYAGIAFAARNNKYKSKGFYWRYNLEQ